MPRSGGTYTLPAGNPVVTGTTISSTTYNNTQSDIASALTQSVSKDGQTTMTGNLPMGGFKLTGLGNGSAASDSATVGQIAANTGSYVATVGGTGDAITLTPSPAITAYAAGQRFSFISSAANTTNVTVNVSGLGAKAVTKYGTTALVANDISGSGRLLTIEYDGTQFQIFGFEKTGTSGHTIPLLDGANTYSAIQKFSKGADVASAAALTLGTDGNSFNVTGTTSITSINTVGIGTIVKLHFSGVLTLTYHATNLILPGAASITTAVGDEFEFMEYATGQWRCTGYSLISGSSAVSGVDNIQTFTSNGTWTKPSGYSSNARVLIQAWGGGGGGGATGTGGFGAAGGGGGGYNQRWVKLSDLGATESVTIGAGGAGGVTNGSDGGNSVFGSWITAYGGSAGVSNIAVPVTGGNGGGYWSKTSGGAGVSGAAGNNGDFGSGGAGGGANAASYVGGNGNYGGGGGGGYLFGTGGAAGGASSFAGGGGGYNTAGSAPAGGGGASSTTGGNGAAGQITVTVFG